MMWMRDCRPDVVRSAAYVCGAKDALGLWLTGEYATDFSNGPLGTAWPPLVAELAGVASDALPPVVEPTAILGKVCPTAADETGLAAGIPVVVGASDGACANLGVGAYRSGSGCLSLSTTGVVRLVRETPPPVRPLAALGGFGYRLDADTWLWGGVVTAAGAALGWLRGLFEGFDMTVERLAQEAASAPPGSAGLLFQPYLQGMYSPEYRPDERAAFTGLAMVHTRPHLARAVLEGVAYSIRAVVEALEALEAHGGGVDTWYVTGGSARSDLWCSILADVLGVELYRREGGTSLGAAMLAACGSFLYPTIQAAGDAMAGPGETISLSSATTEYADLYDAFCQAVGLGRESARAARA
jgi:sugar (pentulose or hexulose) kinase